MRGKTPPMPRPTNHAPRSADHPQNGEAEERPRARKSVTPLRLHLHPDPILRQVCAPVLRFDGGLADLAPEMLRIMYDAKGRGLAAPQAGVAERVFVMDPTWKEGVQVPLVVVNPVLDWASETLELGEEGCLSIPDTPCRVQRPRRIGMSYQDVDGKRRKAEFEGVEARIVLHEMDHLDGILCIDRAEAAA